MQPITYSIIINVLALAASTFLAWFFKEPLVFIIAIILQTHILERYATQDQEGDELDDYPEQPMGFNAELGKRK